MGGYVDIHSHWIPGVDDGVATVAQGLALLSGLKSLGFDTVCATPHMRTGMFDNTRAELVEAYEQMSRHVAGTAAMPEVALGCEHHLDDLVFERLRTGQGIPYPAGRTALVELPAERFPVRVRERLFELMCQRVRPVLAHPERYRPVWRSIEVLDPLLDGGALLVLDLGSLSGQYGRAPRRAAESLLEAGYIYAASSDAHHAEDLGYVEEGLNRLVDLMGTEEAEFLLGEGPRSVLDGEIED